jgi:peptidoglycan/xylan/chitin deacetylase (PgdA/CDA1 family)
MMNRKKRYTNLLKRTLVLLPVLLFALTACSPFAAEPSALDATAIFENALLTATYAITGPTETATPEPPTPLPPTPEPTATITPDPNRTPPALPAVFTSQYLNPMDTPHNYIEDTCMYLKMRWDPNNAAPGTVVMPIMYHWIVDENPDSVKMQISRETLLALGRNLKDQGFEAITIQQLNDFLTTNAKIPERSVILVVDDRHSAESFENTFKAYYDDYGWTYVNGWISTTESSQELIDGNVRLQNEGWVDHQAHGVIHNIPISNNSSEEYMRSELEGSISTIQNVYGKAPIAYVWPGGGFTPRAVEIAQEVGYKLGFTVNPRGPLMFNWIPQANEFDAARPSYIPEGQVNNPLLTLPRYWDQDASIHIDTVRVMGKEAKAYAEQNRVIELEYYDIVCKPITGEIPALAD